MDLMEIRRGLLMAMAGIADSDKEFLCTVTTECSFKDLLTNHPIPLKYKYELCIMKITGTTAPTQGTRSTNWVIFCTQNPSSYGNFMIFNYKTTLDAPDNMLIFQSMGAANQSYFSVSDKKITSSNTTSTAYYIPSGADVNILHIPFRWDTLEKDTTLI